MITMARKKNTTESPKVTISTTPQNIEMLDWLVSRGTFGKTRAEVVERLLSERLQTYLPDRKYEPGSGETDG